MKKLKDISQELNIWEWIGSEDRLIKDIHFDSRLATEKDVFVAIKGTQVDSHKFIDMTDAKVIVVEELPQHLKEDVTYLKVGNTRRALALMLHAFHDYPASNLQIIGVTGTNGKSSSVTLLYHLFLALHEKVGLISTIENRVGPRLSAATHTTPDPKQLVQLFAEMVDAGCTYCFMEVSSHALDQDRVAGIPFRVGVFTNITRDHLDYHETFEAYIAAKKRLFDFLPTNALALVNLDDRHAKVMVQNTRASIKTYAVKKMADYRAGILENTFEGLHLDIDHKEVWFRLLGSFNAYNLLTAYVVARELGFEQEEILQELSMLEGISGRFESIDISPKIKGIVDYAHTPDALKNVLSTIQDINQEGRLLVTVVGAGGDRDKGKRPEMAKISVEWSDTVILTADNPRSEDPEEIIEEMFAGISISNRKKVLRIANRKEAIRTAAQLAWGGGIVLVAGKGHESYQEIKGIKYPFDDREELRKAIMELES